MVPILNTTATNGNLQCDLGNTNKQVSACAKPALIIAAILTAGKALETLETIALENSWKRRSWKMASVPLFTM